jgi:hypothetical protein
MMSVRNLFASRVVLGLMAVMATWQVNAAEVGVHVLDERDRQPLEDAAVCLGTEANPQQFGAQRTDASGMVRFADVPDAPLLLTVSKPQYRGFQAKHAPKRSDVILGVVLHPGGLGPECTAPPVAVASPTGFEVTGFNINRGQRQTSDAEVTLFSQVNGEPTHYRASEHADFRDAEWQPYAPAAQFHLSGPPGEKTVYFQVRRFSGTSGASVQTESEPVSASILLR